MTEYRCYTHGTEHIVLVGSYQGRDIYRCAVEARAPGGSGCIGTQCERVAFRPLPRVPWRQRMMLPERATIERIMATLVVGFWIGVAVWVRFFL